MIGKQRPAEATPFRTDGITAPKPPPLPGSNSVSQIGPDLTVTGNLVSDGDVLINGQVTGDVTCRTLRISEGGRVVGNISAESLEVSGSIDGQIESRDVAISASARVTGDILHVTLSIERGARVSGILRPMASVESRRPGISDIAYTNGAAPVAVPA